MNVTHTRSPGESSVYSFSIVFDEPPAPAALDEFGFATCEPAARRLTKTHQDHLKEIISKESHRVCAPGGLATPDAVAVPTARPLDLGVSESD